MLKIEVKNEKIDNALKILKQKVRNTKQNEELRSRKEFTKNSVKKRQEKKSAIYKQVKKNQDD
jgi:small subunit ribosomal protein S21